MIVYVVTCSSKVVGTFVDVAVADEFVLWQDLPSAFTITPQRVVGFDKDKSK